MFDFDLDTTALEARVRASRHAATPALADRLLLQAGRRAGLAPLDVATLWFAPLESSAIYDAARQLHIDRAGRLETFSPLYLTNTCDAACRMCGMRRDNEALTRETAGLPQIKEQLRLLRRRGMRAVALLTGEYAASRRPWAMGYVNEALRYTQELGFAHVLLNVGSVDANEFEVLLSGIARDANGWIAPNLTMSTFQETYSPRVYAKFMGNDPDNPRADFRRRLMNFERARDAGMRVANPGILVGLNLDVAYEASALVQHAQHLLDRGMEIYVSVPRLRRIAGSERQRGIDDDEYVRLVSLLSLALPAAKIVITTRENSAMQRLLAPIVSVISAGSAAVAPYTSHGAHFPLETSQFEVIDQRPFEAILQDHRNAGATIANFDPPPVTAEGSWH